MTRRLLATVTVALALQTTAGAQERVVRGEVVSSRARYEATAYGDLLVVSRLVLDSGEVVDVVGGTLDGYTLVVAGAPVPRPGRRVSLAVTPEGRGRVLGGSDAFTANPHRWRATVAAAGVPYYVNPANGDVSPTAALAAVRHGADVWALQSDATFRWAYAGTTTGASLVKNFKNEVFFRPVSKSSVIAETYWWYDGAGYLVDADIAFYDGGWRFFTGTSGCSSGAYIEDIAAHEFGHALGLRHTDVGGSTMWPSYQRCSTSFRTLGPDDVAGVEAQYPPDAAEPEPDPTPGAVTLTAGTPKVTVGLKWSGAAGASVDIYVDGARVGTTPNDGAQTLSLTGRGPGPFDVAVCEVGGACSPTVSVAIK